MEKRTTLLLLLALALLMPTISQAELREFKNSAGAIIQAELLSHKGGKVKMRLADGRELDVMPSVFSIDDQAYIKQWMTTTPEDIVYTDKISGTHANFLKASIPDDDGAGPETAKRWKDIWSAGHGVAEISGVHSIERIVDDIVREYHDAVAALPR